MRSSGIVEFANTIPWLPGYCEVKMETWEGSVQGACDWTDVYIHDFCANASMVGEVFL